MARSDFAGVVCTTACRVATPLCFCPFKHVEVLSETCILLKGACSVRFDCLSNNIGNSDLADKFTSYFSEEVINKL